MDFGKYIEKERLSVSDVAAQLGVTGSYIYGILNGQFIPGRVLAMRIAKWSKGEVGFNDLWKMEEENESGTGNQRTGGSDRKVDENADEDGNFSARAYKRRTGQEA